MSTQLRMTHLSGKQKIVILAYNRVSRIGYSAASHRADCTPVPKTTAPDISYWSYSTRSTGFQQKISQIIGWKEVFFEG